MNVKLRPWQQQALHKAIAWLVQTRADRHFLINAAPGAGKTLAACAIAQTLIELGEIDRVMVIAPRSEIVSQWADDFRRVTGRHMGKVTARDGDIGALGIDICATWAAVQGLQPELQAVCRAARVLVICDEHHHAAIEAAWGDSADSACADASLVLVLTGTPIRSDGAQSIWLAYDDAGAIDHPDDGTYTLTYGDAVDLGYCRPVTFHRHEGKFSVDLEGGESVQVSGHQKAKLPPSLARIPALQTALDFYRLARTPQFERDGTTPLLSGYQATMLEWGGAKLTDLRHRMPDAGGLVIAPSIEMAEYMVELIELIEGERPLLVHSQLANPESRIRAFRNTDKRWLVSVAMVSEGVDIKRLRVLVYLPNALTELAFRQAIGRVVRTAGPDDDTRAYVVMPSFDTFEAFARRVENEMPATAHSQSSDPKTKRCPVCGSECALAERFCPGCGHEFPAGPQRLKSCDDCGALNPITAVACHACGATFTQNFMLTLDEALRAGAIVRGMDIDETEVLAAEEIAPAVRKLILRSGDGKLVKILQTLPDESLARLRSILVAQ
ncbi:MAG: DEAD/DEAH box helicase family protein [Accumulibacter sp.]|jgi:superfamily II DNA or RNA helicase|uniref:DEAD/DEAH box helicase n=1 Tax=Accumulibacter sp. TaxID=2053492 RepID=UPI001ACC1111|nr:DEAD/DEAH box helicase family protein [Accumulibacter sp.]MBN8437998.1 DEAD/DEAH box helicase family protein [Accumulibacter sp.]